MVAAEIAKIVEHVVWCSATPPHDPGHGSMCSRHRPDPCRVAKARGPFTHDQCIAQAVHNGRETDAAILEKGSVALIRMSFNDRRPKHPRIIGSGHFEHWRSRRIDWRAPSRSARVGIGIGWTWRARLVQHEHFGRGIRGAKEQGNWLLTKLLVRRMTDCMAWRTLRNLYGNLFQVRENL